MNKTLTINIGGLVFHIEEQAYHKLYQYLEAIKKSIAVEDRQEVIQDIELRIAEIFTAKITTTNQVIVLTDVDEVISIMGKPEDYYIDEEIDATYTEKTYYRERKLFRDKEKGILGGVLAGLAHYFKIDTVWMRLIFLFLVFFYGTGILLYFILWIIIPSAKTASDKLDMMGEPVTIETIERKIKEGVEYTTEKINNIDYQNLKNQSQNVATQGTKVLRFIFGIGFILFSVFGMLISFIVNLALILNSSVIIDKLGEEGVTILSETPDFPKWLLLLFISLITFAPFVVTLLIGLKLIYSNIKYIWTTVIALCVLWIIALIAFSSVLIQNNSSFFDANVIVHRTQNGGIQMNLSEVKSLFETERDIRLIYNASDDAINNAKLKIELIPSFQDEFYAKSNEKITDPENHMTIKKSDKEYDVLITNDLMQNDEVISIYIPINKKIYIDGKIKQLLLNDTDNVQNTNHWYTVNDQLEIICVDCQ